jgi:hypothetical protein
MQGIKNLLVPGLSMVFSVSVGGDAPCQSRVTQMFVFLSIDCAGLVFLPDYELSLCDRTLRLAAPSAPALSLAAADAESAGRWFAVLASLNADFLFDGLARIAPPAEAAEAFRGFEIRLRAGAGPALLRVQGAPPSAPFEIGVGAAPPRLRPPRTLLLGERALDFPDSAALARWFVLLLLHAPPPRAAAPPGAAAKCAGLAARLKLAEARAPPTRVREPVLIRAGPPPPPAAAEAEAAPEEEEEDRSTWAQESIALDFYTGEPRPRPELPPPNADAIWQRIQEELRSEV